MGTKKSMGSMNNSKVTAAEPMADNADGGMDDYEAKDALSTIVRAHEHMQNPALMKRVKKHAGRHVKALASLAGAPAGPKVKSIADLRKARDKASKEEMDETAPDDESAE